MDMRFSLHGKRALVTGASGGLGAHFARLLAANGASVALAARRVSSCQHTAADIVATGGSAVAVELDVGAATSVDSAVDAVVAQFGGLDIVINNAGIAATAALLDQGEEEWSRVLDTNLTGAFRVARSAARHMKGSGGSIINIASILGLRIMSHVGAYAASKAGLVQLTRSMALEWARYKIRVNALCPGYVLTDINRDFMATEAGQAIIKRVPMRRIATPEDLDGPLLLLASDAGAYLTGVALPVDGGHTISSM